jgi:hypothetical protein
MSEDEARREQDEEGADVEAHRKHILANDDPADELRREGDDDDFEAHKKPTGMV